MSKSNHIYKDDIPYEELKYFIDPIKLNIQIPYNDLGGIFRTEIDHKPSYDYINKIYNDLLNHMPYFKQYRKSKIECITYNSHLTGYDFRFNPIDIINNIYKCLKIDYRIPFINLDTDMGMDYLKEYIKTYNSDIKRQGVDYNVSNIIDEINYNVDRICNLYYENLEDQIKDSILPKDALLYIACKSLMLFEKTNEPEYFVIPYEYYNYVSHMKTSPYPHKIYFGDFYNKYWFTDFRYNYDKLEEVPDEADFSNYILPDDEILIAWNILKPGMVERELKDVMHRAKANPDYQKYQALFDMKMNYYMKSGYIKYIKGMYGLLGYVGFSYNNEYLIFDKFHNSETIDPSKRTILTHGEAIFALPSDKFSLLSTNKQKVIEERKVDDRIKKINHTINGSFINRLDEVVNSLNVSTSTLETEVEKQKRKILIKY